MTLDFSIDGKVQISMEEYIRNMLQELPEDMDGMATTPAAEHLFKVNETPTHLDENEAMFFSSQRGETAFPL